MKKTRKAPIILIVILILASLILLSSCSILGGIINRVNDEIAEKYVEDNTDFVYGTKNKLAVGFSNQKMTAFWDDYSNYNSHRLTVVNGAASMNYDVNANQVDLSADYDYEDDLALTLYGTTGSGESATYTALATANYNKISRNNYNTYTKNNDGGWVDFDSYAATRYEFFELFNYMVIFRPSSVAKTENGATTYTLTKKMLIGYDFASIYQNTDLTEDKAFETEVKSAVDAYEDSASYSYSFSYDTEENVCSVTMKFTYLPFPQYETTTNTQYSNALTLTEPAHYTLGVDHTRNFAIDKLTATVAVESSDQLYYAIKKGYKPSPVIGSNAEYIYNYMRYVLAQINEDSTSQGDKVHRIYDYLVNTVIYDYVYVDNTLEKNPDNDKVFLYKCLYLEGVFGFKNDKTFAQSSCVAICDGIAKAYMCLSTIEGIESLKISGTASGVSHAWNKTRIDNNWYMVDATWGNERTGGGTKEYLSHDYLLVAADTKHKEDSWYEYPATSNRNYKKWTLI